MELRIISVGRIKQDFVRQAEAEYVPRLKKWTKFAVDELDVSKFASLPEKERRTKETTLVLEQVKPGTVLVALDEQGKLFSSERFARIIQEKMVGGTSNFCFVIGGAAGWDKELIKRRANLFLSLSPLTFSYQICRVVLIEQLYRALSIIYEQPYHKR